MKTKIIIFFSLLNFFTQQSYAQTFRTGTYNLRLDIASDKENSWSYRAAAVKELIRYHDFDILGTQEAFDHQLQAIVSALPQYAVYGKGRDDGMKAGEHSAILYKKEKFELLNQGDFWFSETPDKPTLGWDATCCKRICSWVYLKHKQSKKTFYVFNAHYDHQGVIARRESSKLVLEKIKVIAGNKPVIFTGDLNGNQQSEPYLIVANSGLLSDTYQQVQYPYALSNSFNGFGANLNGVAIIDHVFVSQHFKANQWGLLTDTYNGKYPSDHFPVLAEISFKK